MPSGDAPLKGRGVLVTRPAGGGRELADGLERLGATVHSVPATRIEPRPAELSRAVLEAGRADWLVFTSANAARLFFDSTKSLEQVGAAIACIGPATADVVVAAGLAVALMPQGAYRAESLLAALVDQGVSGRTVVIPAALVTRDVLAPGLEAAGAVVRQIPIYETVVEPAAAGVLRDLLDRREIDVVTFTSSSSVDAFHALAPEPPPGLVYAAIGPVTAETARARGYAPLLTAVTSTVAGLLDTLVNHYQRGSP